MIHQVDKIDNAILGLVQVDNSISTAEIGERIGLSTTSVQRRLNRLRQNGVIAKEVAVIDSSSVGCKMTFIVNVEFERERLDLLEDFKKAAIKSPEIQQCYYVTGEADVVMIVVARDMDHYEEFTRSAFFSNGNIRRFRTSVVMQEYKKGLELPLAERV